MRPVLTTINLSAPDAHTLAAFYAALLGWDVAADEPDWVMIGDPAGGTRLSFQTEPSYARPVWPAEDGTQQMMMHLELRVDELGPAVARATELGATLAAHQPQADVRVCLDPAGHPFCLWVESGD